MATRQHPEIQACVIKLVPFHLPTHKIRETKHQACKDLLHNVQSWNKFLAEQGVQQLPCPCQQFANILSPVCFVQGHIAAGIEFLGALHSEMHFLGQGSANSTFFPSQHQYLAAACASFARWRSMHGLPKSLDNEFRCFLQQQWSWHLQAVRKHRRLEWPLIQRCKKALLSFVIHCEDHHPNHLMAFCPQFYFASVMRTWSDPLVFRPLSTNAEQLRL